ncbi:hypothetical protein Srubr_70260 [Streptomyces rubradiris]|uniref:Uncharacterized protein n=2 Tax=Streptomyces rubradiris TaxID=285531 RepID=A0ABQ3RN11_STRRR|nr:hypothetical protein GCM10018792_18810 [Streptomyces rubradiris]GHI57180.1 hypothetical protein Srubr_70260 [Streptomyces rubradiris]
MIPRTAETGREILFTPSCARRAGRPSGAGGGQPAGPPAREPYPGGMSTAPESAPEPRAPKPALVFDDPLDQQSSDDTDRGWGERTDGDSAADLKRFLDEKPPHHL